MDIWTELYDPKDGRKLREIPMGGTCKKCGKWNGHRLDCEEVDTEQLYRIAKQAQAAEEHARKLADRYWRMLQQYQGKLATLKHENNKLRKANEKLRSEKAAPVTDGETVVPLDTQALKAWDDQREALGRKIIEEREKMETLLHNFQHNQFSEE